MYYVSDAQQGDKIMALIIKTKMVKVHGLETWQVVINGTVLATFMSEQMARTKVKQCLIAWNVEKIQNQKAV